MTAPRALVVDFYGVLTDGLDDAMSQWCAADGIDYQRFREVMGEWLGPEGYANAAMNPVYALERGEMQVPDFERRLAERVRPAVLPGRPEALATDGLLSRMFDRFRHAPDMAALVRRAKDAGLATALLSNSWGDQYLRDGWDDMFDVVVISGEVGMRKPEARIFEHTSRLLGCDGSQVVFVDDHIVNVQAAAQQGWVSIHHTSYEQTAAELETLFGIPLVH